MNNILDAYMKKKSVTFSSSPPIIHQWLDDEDRKSKWMLIAVDRVRFYRRIQTTQRILEPTLNKQHRAKIVIQFSINCK